MILALCVHMGRDEDWFYDLPSGKQARLIGWWRSRTPTASPKKQRASRAAQALAQQVADKRKKYRAKNEGAEDFWFTGG